MPVRNFATLTLCALLLIAAGCKKTSSTGTSSATQPQKTYTTIDWTNSGTIAGTIHFTGEAPKRIPIDMGQDPVCSLAPTNLTEQYVVDHRGLENVLVSIQSGLGEKAYAPPWGVSIVLILQLEKRLMRPGIVNNILASSLYTRSGKWKHVIVVDEDINIEDPNEVLWALTTRFQPATDMFVIPRSITSSLEPSAGADGLTSKLMLDLTIKENFRGEVAEPTDAMRQAVLQRWKEYGFK